jgi:cellulose synthase/poly-beta-1,6-N-acetylglucosamine synthase-like glycosyltransferase
MATATFWTCAFMIAYAYILYPASIGWLSRRFGARPEPPSAPEADLPSVTIVVAAYNEEDEIAECLRNALAADYPPGRLDVLVGSDGSDDRTAEIVSGFAGRGVRLLDFPRRRGKAAVLNATLPEAKGEIIALTDANTRFDREAILRLARWFRDPGVGVVCGRLDLIDPETGRNTDGLYWKYETYIKRCEARLGALLGANGAIYAIRRSCYVPIPAGTIIDDFVIPLLARLRHGCRIVYDADAIAREQASPDVVAEFHRRTRIGAGGFQSLGLLWRYLDPRRGWVWFAFVSHKLIRWLCPFFLIGLLAAGLALSGSPFYRAAVLGQVAFFSLALLGPIVPARRRAPRLVHLAGMFTAMNLALLLGFFRWASNGQSGAWRRTVRAKAEGSLS